MDQSELDFLADLVLSLTKAGNVLRNREYFGEAEFKLGGRMYSMSNYLDMLLKLQTKENENEQG